MYTLNFIVSYVYVFDIFCFDFYHPGARKRMSQAANSSSPSNIAYHPVPTSSSASSSSSSGNDVVVDIKEKGVIKGKKRATAVMVTFAYISSFIYTFIHTVYLCILVCMCTCFCVHCITGNGQEFQHDIRVDSCRR